MSKGTEPLAPGRADADGRAAPPGRRGSAVAAVAPLLNPAARLVDAGTGDTLTGARLVTAWQDVARALDAAPPGVVLCLTATDVPSVVRYLGTLAAGRAAALRGRDAPPAQLDELVRRFEPAVVAGLPDRPLTTPPGYSAAGPGPLGAAWIRRSPPSTLPDDALALMLGTSGSTGQPRLVRLAGSAVVAGVRAIREALDIAEDDVALTTLPLFHTYGLSVLHSHLLAGATTVIEPHGVLDRRFWTTVDRHGVTSIAGVPHLFEVLARKPWHPASTPGVRALTVSGGRLPDPLATRFHEAMAAQGGRLFVMYGQTEAGSRICVLPPERLPDKLGSVGPPVPGMTVTVEPSGPDDRGVDDIDGDGDGEGGGEVVCRSASVMSGYAETAADLARGDEVHGVLRTGDHGRLDGDGCLWLTGRLGRIGKAFGMRVNLDAVEHVAGRTAPSAALADGDRVRLVCEGLDRAALADVVASVATALGVPRGGVRASAVDRLPRLPNGKVDYRSVGR